MINEPLTQLGITLPSVAPPFDPDVGCVMVGRTAYVGGHGDASLHTRTAVGMAASSFDIGSTSR